MISNERIAKAFAIDKSTVKRHTQRLRQLGYLKVTHKGHRRGDGLPTANVYDLCLPDSQGLTHEPSRQFSRAHLGILKGSFRRVSMAHNDEPPSGVPPRNPPGGSPLRA